MNLTFEPITTLQVGGQWEALHSKIRHLTRGHQLRASRNRFQPPVAQRFWDPKSVIFQTPQPISQTDSTAHSDSVLVSASFPDRLLMNVIQVVGVGAVVSSASGLVLASSADTIEFGSSGLWLDPPHFPVWSSGWC